ncbi:MAG TPA: BPL-N domain-containing protein [Rhabdochlamydiaceae bacterium]
MSQALVYADQGVCLPSAAALERQLKSLLDPSVSVLKVDGAYLRTKAWEDKTAVLVMGGGSCRYWDEQLQAEGIEKIQRYVKGGGRYIGICAGAYFASAESHFELSDRIIEKSRALAFFPGRAVGPLVDRDDYLSLKAARAAEVCFKFRGSTEDGALYYQGGCLFDLEEDSAAVEIMSTYRGLEKAAAVFCKVGKGCAFLDGTHPEFEWRVSLGEGADNFYSKLAEKLSSQEVFRQRVWEEIGTKLGLK